MPAAAVPGVAGAPPGPPLAEMVGGDGVADRGRSDPKAARFCGGGGANIGPGVPCDVAGAAGGVWLGTGLLAAAGGGAEAGADAGATLVAAGGGVGATGGVVGTDGGSGLPALAARPLVNPCERSLAAVAGVGRPAGVVGVAGMLGVLGMDGIDGGRIELADMPDPIGDPSMGVPLLRPPDAGAAGDGPIALGSIRAARSGFEPPTVPAPS